MREAPVHPDAPRCWHCLYNLTGLAATGPCPECGKPYDFEDGPPPSKADRVSAALDDLPREIRYSWPWIWERIQPSSRTVMILLASLGLTALLVWIGSQTMAAIGRKFGPPPTTCRFTSY